MTAIFVACVSDAHVWRRSVASVTGLWLRSFSMAGMAEAVELLADRPGLVDALATIRWRDWGDDSAGETLEWWIDITRTEAGRGELPVTFVAVDDVGDAVGGVTLKPFELTEEQHRGRTPWVGGMIVRADRRGSGIGTMLMATLEAWAREARIPQAWVVASADRAVDFYRTCGWSPVETVGDGGRSTVLTKSFVGQ